MAIITLTAIVITINIVIAICKLAIIILLTAIVMITINIVTTICKLYCGYNHIVNNHCHENNYHSYCNMQIPSLL